MHAYQQRHTCYSTVRTTTTTTTTTTTRRFTQGCPLFCSVVTCPGRDLSGQSSMAERDAAGCSARRSADCARSCTTRSWRSRWPCPKPCTTLLFQVHGTCRTQPYEDRIRTGQGCGHAAWVSRQGSSPGQSSSRVA